MRVDFDDFVLDTDARELRSSGVAVHLSPKAFDLLQVLIERRPTAVSKSDLHHLLWRDTFVTDTSLATLVSELRHALGDEARRPRYVRTVHAYGYAFCAAAAASAQASASGGRFWIEWEGRQYPLNDGENVLGRAAGSTIVIELPEVSRQHARIVVSSSGALLADLGSRNSTFVGDVQITTAHALREGDEIRIGPARLTFHAALDGATTKALAPTNQKSLKEP